jgi:microcompartment protein CcmK/EutM
MNLAMVRGSVVASRRADGLASPRYILAESCGDDGTGKGEYLVALDMVGAERGQLVLLAQGSSCRWTYMTADKPMDALAIAIVDEIDRSGATVFREAGR